jgi:signal transduction histidine kinase
MAPSPRPSEIERLRLIARIAARMHEEQELEPLLQGTADALHEALGFPNVDIPLIDPNDRDTLVVTIRGGHYKHAIRQVDRIPLGRGIMGSAARTRRTELVNDVRADPRYVCPPGVEPAQAELAVPIRAGGEVLGVINVESDRPFDELDQLSIETVADFLGIALRNLRLVPAARDAAVLVERQRLARELHDNVTQILSSISLLSQTLESAWRRDPVEGSKRIARLQQLSQTAFAEMRMLLRELSPPQGAAPAEVSRRSRTFAGLELLKQHALPGALERLLKAMAPEDLTLRLDFGGYVPQLIEHEETLYRVCQEAVSNAIRHAHAKRLWVSAAATEDQAVVQIADDGCGIGNEFRPGLGLSSMRTRLEFSGGQLRITPNTPRGTLIEARLPRADRVAS